jgi:hypothetical protein
MEGPDYPIEHFKLMVSVSEHLKSAAAQILKHEYHYQTFGSWWTVFRRHGEKYRLIFDGRDTLLILQRFAAEGPHAEDWNDIEGKTIPINDQSKMIDHVGLLLTF